MATKRKATSKGKPHTAPARTSKPKLVAKSKPIAKPKIKPNIDRDSLVAKLGLQPNRASDDKITYTLRRIGLVHPRTWRPMGLTEKDFAAFGIV